jgi:hypothetical protein
MYSFCNFFNHFIAFLFIKIGQPVFKKIENIIVLSVLLSKYVICRYLVEYSPT